MIKESAFQKQVIDEILSRFPGAMVLKNDPGYIQGIPDLTVFYGRHWATLECKRSKDEAHQPNQDYYVERMNGMSYSAFICPENRDEVMNGLAALFGG